jgi:hypothetical protein
MCRRDLKKGESPNMRVVAPEPDDRWRLLFLPGLGLWAVRRWRPEQNSDPIG